MNQDFGLSLTPAIARRLIRFQQASNLILPESLIEVAMKDQVGDVFDIFVCPHDSVKQEITQFLLDCNLRGIIQQNYHPEFNEIAVINAVRIMKPTSITIHTNRVNVWKIAVKAFFIENITNIVANVSNENIDDGRSGVLIIDGLLATSTKLQNLACEFPRTIMFDANQSWDNLTPWPTWTEILCPTMPTAFYPRIVKNVSKAYNKPLHMFAPLYNVCMFPELMGVDALEHLYDGFLKS